MKTYQPKAGEIERRWFLVDATGQNLGRLAVQVANLLHGKGKPSFVPHLDVGDFVVVINAEKVAVTGKKLTQKTYYHHSQHPGGIKAISLGKLLDEAPERVIERSVRGMIRQLGRRALLEAEGVRRCRSSPCRTAAGGAGGAVDRGDKGRMMEATIRCPGTGRRKASVARVWLQAGAGKIEVNERSMDEFFPRQTLRMILSQPLRVAGVEGKYDVMATVIGGGISGQAGAIRLGIARALLKLDVAMRSTLKKAGLLTRDPRAEETKEVRPEGGAGPVPVLQTVAPGAGTNREGPSGPSLFLCPPPPVGRAGAGSVARMSSLAEERGQAMTMQGRARRRRACMAGASGYTGVRNCTASWSSTRPCDWWR